MGAKGERAGDGRIFEFSIAYYRSALSYLVYAHNIWDLQQKAGTEV